MSLVLSHNETYLSKQHEAIIPTHFLHDLDADPETKNDCAPCHDLFAGLVVEALSAITESYQESERSTEHGRLVICQRQRLIWVRGVQQHLRIHFLPCCHLDERLDVNASAGAVLEGAELL